MLLLGFAGLVALNAACSSRDVTNLTVKGSDTEVNVVLELAEAFMADDSSLSIGVTGGGSGMGVASLINGKTDIANASRPFEAEELKLAHNRHVDPIAIIFATDAIAFIVHPDQSVKSLTLADLKGLYTRKITNWKQLGGADRRVSLYGRQSNSGTFVYVRETLLRADYSPTMKQMNGNAQIVEAVKTDRGGIGYVGIGYVADERGRVTNGIRVLSLKAAPGQPAYSPTDRQAVLTDNYPVVRPLFQYTNGKPTGKLRAFLQFELSAAGQRLIRHNGYFPISARYKAKNQQQDLSL